jgi:hypothetical protein
MQNVADVPDDIGILAGNIVVIAPFDLLYFLILMKS